MKKLILLVLMIIIPFMITVPAYAGQWYVGGGLNSVSLGDDLNGIDSGQGITLNFGYYFQPTFSLDFNLGFSGHEDNFGDDSTYTRFDVGAQFAFGIPEGGVVPYIGAGFGAHNLDYDDYVDTLVGTSLFLSAGFDFYITPGHSVDFGLRVHTWDFDIDSGSVIYEDAGHATTTVISVMYNYHFLLL